MHRIFVFALQKTQLPKELRLIYGGGVNSSCGHLEELKTIVGLNLITLHKYTATRQFYKYVRISTNQPDTKSNPITSP